MNSSDQPQDMFGADTLSLEQVEELKQKLAWTISNRMHAESALGTLSAPLKEEIKGFKKLTDVLAKCIRDKSRLELIYAYGENNADDKLAGIRPMHAGEFG